MSYDSQVLALSNLVAYWRLNDTAGATTAADSGSNTLPLTYSSGKVAGPNLVSGLGTSMQGDGTAMRAVTGSIASGNPLRVASNITVGMWVQFNAIPAANAVLIGRQNNWLLQVTNSGAPDFIPTLAGTTNGGGWFGPYPHTPWNIVTGTPYFIAGTYNGVEQYIYINGQMVMSRIVPGGTFTGSTDILSIGNNGTTGTYVNAAFQGAFVTSSALNAGQLLSLYKANTNITPPVEGFTRDYIYSASSTVVSGAADGTPCSICGGKRKTNEPAVTSPAGNIAHPACDSLRRSLGSATQLSTSSTPKDFAAVTLKCIHDLFIAYCTRPTPDKAMWFDGTHSQPNSIVGNAGQTWENRSAIQLASTLAIVHRLAGMPYESHWMEFMRKAVDQWFTAFNGYSSSISEFDFVSSSIGMILYCMKDILPSDVYNRWLNLYVQCGESMLKAPNTNGTGNPEMNYYTNGNRELFWLNGLYMLYKVTGDSKWNTLYEQQWTWTLNPAALATPTPYNHAVSSAGGDSAGLRYVVNDITAHPDGSTSQAYLGETNDQPSPPNGIAGYERDWDYTQTQLLMACRLYCVSGDARALQLVNLLTNLALNATNGGNPRVNQSTWVYDATGGSRHTLTTSWANPALALLSWKGGRSDITTATVVSQVKYQMTNLLVNATSAAGAGNYEAVNHSLGGLLMANPLWTTL
jgi:hypothetical protein